MSFYTPYRKVSQSICFCLCFCQFCSANDTPPTLTNCPPENSKTSHKVQIKFLLLSHNDCGERLDVCRVSFLGFDDWSPIYKGGASKRASVNIYRSVKATTTTVYQFSLSNTKICKLALLTLIFIFIMTAKAHTNKISTNQAITHSDCQNHIGCAWDLSNKLLTDTSNFIKQLPFSQLPIYKNQEVKFNAKIKLLPLVKTLMEFASTTHNPCLKLGNGKLLETNIHCENFSAKN